MKLFNSKKINKFFKNYTSLLLSGLLLFTKKENPKISMILLLISILGLFINNDSSSIENEKSSKSWKDFINKKLNKIPDFISEDNENNEDNENSEDNENNEDQENNIINDVKESNEDKENTILENIKSSFKKIHQKIKQKRDNKKVDKTLNIKPYVNKVQKMNNEYNDRKNHYFELKVNDNNKNLPLFNLRSSDNIDFYWNFHLHNADNTKINNLILCRDIHQWMNSSSLSDEDLDNKCYPIYLIIKDHKTNNEVMIFEAYKLFVYMNETGNKQAFVSKGDNYKTIEEMLNILVEMDYIKDLLNEKDYESYNLTSHDSVCLFLNNILSHFLPSDSQNGEVINIDMKQYNENRETFDYFYHTFSCDNDMFNTNI